MFYKILAEELKNGGIEDDKIERAISIVRDCEIN